MNPDPGLYKKYLSARLTKEAARLSVRECDASGPGQYEGFVDDGPATYDVVLHFAPGGELQLHQCDCGRTGFCAHRAAMLLHICAPKEGKEALPKGKARKKGELEQLLDDASDAELRAWLLALFPVHKDLALAFRSRFGNSDAHLNPEAITRQSAEAVKAIAGRQQTIDAVQVGKILALWTDLHRPVLAFYAKAPYDAAHFQSLQALFTVVAEFSNRYLLSSKKLLQYEESLQQQVVSSLAALEEGESWTQAVRPFLAELGKDPTRYRTQVYLRLLAALAVVESPARRALLAKLFAEVYPQLQEASGLDRAALANFAFGFFETCGVLNEYLDALPVLPWQPEYNQRLLEALLAAGHTERAEAMALAEMRNNRHDVYNRPYRDILRSIYRQRGDEEKLTRLLAEQLPLQPDIEDYDYVAKRIDADSLRLLRNRLLSRASGGGGPEWQRFAFTLLARDGDWKKMIALLATTSVPAALLPWLKELKEYNAADLLNGLLSWSGPSPQRYETRDETEAAEEAQLAQDLITLYGSNVVRTALVRQQYNYKKPGAIWWLTKELLEHMDDEPHYED